jgi:epoxyqueuosine reductase
VNTSQITQLIKQLSVEQGFDFCGITPAKELTEDAKILSNWLDKGYHGDMKYLENHFDLRIDPRKLVPGAKSVIVFSKNYFPESQPNDPTLKIAKYAWGEDYHNVIKDKLHSILASIRSHVGDIEGRGFVDSAPVLEKSWAQLAGLGWIGNNSNLIQPKKGSFYFLATLIIDLALEYDSPFTKDLCGTCSKCIDACPTNAIQNNKTIIAHQCISYFTIESKADNIQPEKNYKDWAFGCDICQDVCPWNRFSAAHQEERFKPLHGLLEMKKENWMSLSEDAFKKEFKKSPISRAKLKGIQRNITYLDKKIKGE